MNVVVRREAGPLPNPGTWGFKLCTWGYHRRAVGGALSLSKCPTLGFV